MDKVELLTECPWILDIIDLEAAIGGHKLWLNCGQICSQDLRRRILSCTVDGPDASSCANIKDVLGILYGCMEEFSTEGQSC